MKKQAILFVDVDDRDLPSYSYRESHFVAAKRIGLSCLVATGKNRKNTERLFCDSDEVYVIDKISEDNLLVHINSIALQYDIKAIFCHAGHVSRDGKVIDVVANTCEKLGFPYSPAEALMACNNKFLMREKLKEHNIKSTRYVLCHDIKDALEQARNIGYPLIFKPPFGAGSAFVKKCHTKEELSNHYALFINNHDQSSMADFYGSEHKIRIRGKPINHYIPGRTVLLEEYIEGIEGTVECVVHDGTVSPILINEKLILTQKSGTILENLLICPAVSFSSKEIQLIKQYAIDCIRALGLKNDIVHLEFRLDKNGPAIIEINPRLGGLYVDAAFKTIVGIDPYDLYLSMLLRKPQIDTLVKNGIERAKNYNQHFAMMVIYPEKSGYFTGFNNLDYLENNILFSKYDTFPAGHHINAEVEENYLLKCWVRVVDKTHAYSIYDELLQKVSPIITTEITNSLECV